MTREITHMKAFAAALDSLGKPRFSVGQIPPTAGLVDQFFNDSTGEGEHGEVDARGPWNEGGSWEFVEAPALHDAGDVADSPSIHAASSDGIENEAIQELLADQLRYSSRREATAQGIAEDVEGGTHRAAQTAYGHSPRRDRGSGRAAERKP